MDYKNIFARAGWTFVQAGLAALPVAQVTAAILGSNITGLEQLGLMGLSAGVGGVLSFLKTIAQEQLVALGARYGRHEA